MENIIRYTCEQILQASRELTGNNPCPTNDCYSDEDTFEDCLQCWVSHIESNYECNMSSRLTAD